MTEVLPPVTDPQARKGSPMTPPTNHAVNGSKMFGHVPEGNVTVIYVAMLPSSPTEHTMTNSY